MMKDIFSIKPVVVTFRYYFIILWAILPFREHRKSSRFTNHVIKSSIDKCSKAMVMWCKAREHQHAAHRKPERDLGRCIHKFGVMDEFDSICAEGT